MQIIVHSHPSGDSSPSQVDIEMTEDVHAACENLGIQLHDHIIVSASGTNSFKSMELL